MALLCDIGLRGHGYHELLVLAATFHLELGYNVVIFEPPAEFDGRGGQPPARWIDQGPHLIFKVLDHWRVPRRSLHTCALGCGCAVGLQMLLQRPAEPSDGAFVGKNLWVNPRSRDIFNRSLLCRNDPLPVDAVVWLGFVVSHSFCPTAEVSLRFGVERF